MQNKKHRMTYSKPPILKSAKLAGLKNVRHAFFTRHGGVSKGVYESLNVGFGSNDNPKSVKENRRRAMAVMKMPLEALHTVHQVHGANVVEIKDYRQNNHSTRDADAMVTKHPGNALGILTADCVPVLFADPVAGVAGAAHSGWKGTLLGVLEATVVAMENLGANRNEICAAVGPAIGQFSYEVGPEFHARILKFNAKNECYFVPSRRCGHYMFNLTGYVKEILKNLSISVIDHVDFDTCSICEKFYSYRRAVRNGELDYGRSLSVISIVD